MGLSAALCLIAFVIGTAPIDIYWTLIIALLLSIGLVAFEEIHWWPRRKYDVTWLWQIPKDKCYWWKELDKRYKDISDAFYVWNFISLRWKGWWDLLCNSVGIYAVFVILNHVLK